MQAVSALLFIVYQTESMKEQSSRKVGHLSSMINTESSTSIGGGEGSSSCNLDNSNNINMSTTTVDNNDQQYSGEMTSGKKEYTSCEQK